MDTRKIDVLYAVHEPMPSADGNERERQNGNQPTPTPIKSAGRRLGRGLSKAMRMQDKILESVMAQIMSLDDGTASGGGAGSSDPDASHDASKRPGFTVAAMSNNFRRFNARIGVVFRFQARLIRLLSWRRPVQTLSLLAVYTFVCLDPYLLLALPLVLALFGMLVPSFVERHPAPGLGLVGAGYAAESRVRNLGGYNPGGPPLAPARTIKPVKELSRDFFCNMGDLQNSMDDFCVAHDKIVALIVPATNFADEALSSAIFVILCALCIVAPVAVHLLPWRLLILASGWAAIWSGHPVVARWLAGLQKEFTSAAYSEIKAGINSKAAHRSTSAPPPDRRSAFEAWVRSDIILDESPETREVEIFELQRRSGGELGEWEAWLFSPSPYDPLSAARLAGEAPRGARYFEDVRPPPGGWDWSEKKWALDLWSREWVEERIITGVEVETEAERWVYDMYNENAVGQGGVVDHPVLPVPTPVSFTSWAELNRDRGLDDVDGLGGVRRTGLWRRRRWVRMVKRKHLDGMLSLGRG